MPPVTSSSSKPQQIQTEWGTWQSSGQERCGLTYLFYIYIYIYVCMYMYDRYIHRGRKISGCQGWGRNGSMIATGNRVSFGSDENILELDTLDGCTIL